ncbi:MAG: hypothetical protein Q9226_008789 [Calogaya cf. arnoldii]
MATTAGHNVGFLRYPLLTDALLITQSITDTDLATDLRLRRRTTFLAVPRAHLGGTCGAASGKTDENHFICYDARFPGYMKIADALMVWREVSEAVKRDPIAGGEDIILDYFGASVAAKCQRIYYQLDYSGLINTIVLEILLAEEVNWESLRIDKSILNDLKYYEDTRSTIVDILESTIDESHQEGAEPEGGSREVEWCLQGYEPPRRLENFGFTVADRAALSPQLATTEEDKIAMKKDNAEISPKLLLSLKRRSSIGTSRLRK